MSDALDYLIGARPEAMTAYFKFIKQAGAHLDPKTRSLISVITKVSAQTEKGFKQYLTRALRDGATANEVIDALLMAFPVLGLTKIIWAVEQLRELDLPEFSLEALQAMPGWHEIGEVTDFQEGTQRVACDERELFVDKRGDQIKVYDSHCPHQVTNIPELAIEGEQLTCPKHGWKFDLKSGDCIEKGKRPLTAFETRVQNGLLEAFW